MIPALRWAAMKAILMFHNCEGQSHKTVSTDHNFCRERKAEADSNRGPSAYQLSALPLGQTSSQSQGEKTLQHPQSASNAKSQNRVELSQYQRKHVQALSPIPSPSQTILYTHIFYTYIMHFSEPRRDEEQGGGAGLS